MIILMFTLAFGLNLGVMKLPGFVPKIIFDGGGYTGDWSKEVKQHFPNSDVRFIVVEASPAKIPNLKEKTKALGKVDVVNCVLSEKDGMVEFYDGETGASRFKEDSRYFQNAKKVMLRGRRIDDILKETTGSTEVDILKLDIQGSELVALLGFVKNYRLSCNLVLII